MHQRTRAGDSRNAEVRALGDGVAAVKCQRAVVGDNAARRKFARRASATDLQRAEVDRRRARVGVVAGENPRAGVGLGQANLG